MAKNVIATLHTVSQRITVIYFAPSNISHSPRLEAPRARISERREKSSYVNPPRWRAMRCRRRAGRRRAGGSGRRGGGRAAEERAPLSAAHSVPSGADQIARIPAGAERTERGAAVPIRAELEPRIAMQIEEMVRFRRRGDLPGVEVRGRGIRPCLGWHSASTSSTRAVCRGISSSWSASHRSQTRDVCNNIQGRAAAAGEVRCHDACSRSEV